MEIAIRNMVCRQCVNTVKRLLAEANITYSNVELGKAEIDDNTTQDKLQAFDCLLNREGFERILDPESALVEKVKLSVLHHVRNENDNRHNLSECIYNDVGVNYDTISRVFSAKEGRTIEKYYIAQKIEWVKELLNYGDLTLSEIAYKTGYSSVAHLSRQFKSVTGFTPTEYLKTSRERENLNEI